MVEGELHPELKVRLAQECFTSFGDASHSAVDELKDIEVLAAAPEFATQDGLQMPGGEIKYSYYHSLTKVNKVEAARWDRLLQQCSIYVFDPIPAMERIREHYTFELYKHWFGSHFIDWWLRNELYNEMLRMHPEYWLNVLDLERDSVIWHVGTSKMAKAAAQRIYDGTNNIPNLRRVLLESQHMYRHVLDDRPKLTKFDDKQPTLKWSVDIHDLITSIACPVVFDGGHESDLPVLEAGRIQQHSRLLGFSQYSVVPDYVPAEIATRPSHVDFRIQVADVAAGKAKRLYQSGRLEELRTSFCDLVVNGTRQVPREKYGLTRDGSYSLLHRN
ncbi:MAG TPA: hypothetical protein VGL56_18320 [Fimbriimonadaceae bacterium]|jgi:hypothetical protein